MHPQDDAQQLRDGMVSAILAYVMWGVLPVYFKVVGDVVATEVLAHRIIWAVPFGALIVIARRQGPEVWRALMHPRMLGFLSLSAALIAVNWLIYIVAVQRDQIFQASLGYYINPLMYVLTGVLLLGERLGRLQLAAVVFAATGVTVLTVSGGEFPWIALSLATLFTMYGVIRKKVVIGGMPGLFVETLVLFPAAVAWWAWLAAHGSSGFSPGEPARAGVLMLAGPVTVVPLLFFALAARRLPLSMIGFLQFIAPTLQFAMGVVYGERLTRPHIICFVLIWSAVGLFIVDVWRRSRQRTAVGISA